MPNEAVKNHINDMAKARHGGDYATIFQGKTLAFKFSKIREDASDLNETSQEVAEAMTPIQLVFQSSRLLKIKQQLKSAEHKND